MERAFFKEIRSKIISQLEDAKKEVIVAMAWFTSGELFEALLNCRKRKVSVKLVLLDNATNFMPYAPDFNELISAGGIVRIARLENGFMHHKFCVIDGRLVITGSYNWTYYAETRNLENILITDNPDAVKLYLEAFNHLVEETPAISFCQRVSWEDLKYCQDIDYDELNYEINNIAKYHNLPERKVIKSSSTVVVEKHTMTPISRFNIGLRVTTDNNNDAMALFVKAGEYLPYTSPEQEFNSAIETRQDAICDILYEYNGFKVKIKEEPIKRITGNSAIEDLTIRIQYTLLPTGHLLVQLKCVETQLVMNVKCDNVELVDYA